MTVLELIDYTLAPEGSGKGLKNADFSLSAGDVCAVRADSGDDASLFIRALATLIRPVSGTYRFKGESIALSNYRNTLPVKQKIGYITMDSAMISNRTLHENLLFMRYYHEDDLTIDLDAHTMELCHRFDLSDKLHRKPGELHSQDILNAMAIREIRKPPEVLLLERPEDVMDHIRFDFFIEELKILQRKEVPIVLYTSDTVLANEFSNRKVLISNGQLVTLTS